MKGALYNGVYSQNLHVVWKYFLWKCDLIGSGQSLSSLLQSMPGLTVNASHLQRGKFVGRTSTAPPIKTGGLSPYVLKIS